ncbi:MAG: monovalent cation/H(+) antiporter subunit G [Clostridiales bacterium]|nr:monovalent cation/H(+) antiporter subunit G [Clostridiales bacterium]
MSILSIILMSISFVIMLCTIILQFRFHAFYERILVSGNIDTVGMIFFMVATFFSAPSVEFVLKAALVLVLALITNPISSHATARSAFISGYRPQKLKRKKR